MARNVLNRGKAEAIRARHRAGGLSHQKIADEFGVSQPMVSKILRGEAWVADVTCSICSTTFEPRGSTHAFCSESCFVVNRRRRAMDRHWRLNPKPQGRECPHCGDALSDAKRSDALFCRKACEQAAHNATRKASWKVGSRQERVSRAFIIERDGSMCHICGKKCEPEEIHLDHVVALAKGGTHEPENIKVSCARCNLSKGARLLDEIRKRTRLRGDLR